ncbi:MAG: KTSC domain-containing protein [Bacteroidales bacterium]|nr:KTSC domain-containing protein [Bacteroidales bacterium]
MWFVNILIGLSHYFYVGRKEIESKYVIIQTSMPFLDSLLSVLSYGTIINSCFFLANEVVNGKLIGLNIDWLSIFIAVFIILFWSIKRLFDMGKHAWVSYMNLSAGKSTQVESTLINKIKYNAEKMTLIVAFSNGSQYEYKKISQSVYSELEKAESKGKYFHDKIRDKYRYEKIT